MWALHGEVVWVHDRVEPAISINMSPKAQLVPGMLRIVQAGVVRSFPLTYNSEVLYSRCDGRCRRSTEEGGALVEVVVEESRLRQSGVGLHCIEGLGGPVKEVAFPVVIFGAI